MKSELTVLDTRTPPPKLTIPGPAPMRDDEERPPIIQPEVPNEANKSNGFQVVYSHPSPETPQPTRPVTPLQITFADGTCSPIVPISCGSAHGFMHLNMFYCPGIHQPCIELGNEILSPKQFTVRGDKERQKDWKASIRIGKSSLRTHMEANTIDFFDHANRCSGKCQSRNYVNVPGDRDESAPPRKHKRTASVSVLKDEIESEMNKDVGAIEHKTPSPIVPAVTRTFSETKKARGRPRGSVNKPRQIKAESQFMEEFFTSGDAPSQNFQQTPPVPHIGVPPPQPERARGGCSSYNDIVGCLQDDPYSFWTQMQQSGVIGHFCDDIIVAAINLKNSVADHPLTPQVASILSRGTFAFGAQNVVVNRVQSIERSVHLQRKHEEMFLEIQAKVAEDKLLKEQEAQRQQEAIPVVSDVRTAEEIVDDPEEFIDVVKFDEYPSTSPTFMPNQPGPSTVL